MLLHLKHILHETITLIAYPLIMKGEYSKRRWQRAAARVGHKSDIGGIYILWSLGSLLVSIMSRIHKSLILLRYVVDII